MRNIKKFNPLFFFAKGRSMLPFLLDGNPVIINKRRLNRFNRGDILFYKKNGREVLHRLIRIKGDKFEVRGDSQLNSEFIDLNDILGYLQELKFYNIIWIKADNPFFRFAGFLWTFYPEKIKWMKLVYKKIGSF